jgi:hypothetical protein
MLRRLKNQETFQSLGAAAAISDREAAYLLAAAPRVNDIPKFLRH